MRSIERLPESVHSSVRSGVVIRDLATIVEELIFNSLEAGATKVYVAVGVGSCYVTVVDNGSGITRDGLVLLGERQATSKVDQMTMMDIGVENLDFHGRALCSISNVSLLEIVTKARGKPNGYRKIIKNSKCLFLGISDDRQEVGTNVMIRDIFYNQPVRRKHMESSPNKVLDSIKMSVLRVALVHANVCFKVVDVESADELLHNGPSSSPLQLLCSSLGIEDSTSFYKVDLSDGDLKLSGFISDPCAKFYLKAIQYVYINSRFVCKGPIHKLLHQMAVKFDSSHSWLPASNSQNDRQNKYDICPTFVLNLCCPRSYYDMITSGQSRRLVEFKDWGPVLTFIEEVIMRLWTQNMSHVQHTNPRRSFVLESDMPGTSQRRKRSIKQNCQSTLDLSSLRWKKLRRNYDSITALEEYASSTVKPCRSVPEVERYHTVEGFQSETDYRSLSSDGSLTDFKISMTNNIWSHPSPSGVLLENVPYEYDTKVDGLSSPALQNILPEFNDNIDQASTSSGFSVDCVKFISKLHVGRDKRKSHVRNCSFERSSHDRSRARDELLEFGSDDDTRILKRWVGCDDDILDEINLDTCRRDLHHNKLSPSEASSSMTHYDMCEISEFPDSSKVVWKGTSILQPFRSGWSRMPTEKVMRIKFCGGDDDSIYGSSVNNYSEFGMEKGMGIEFHDGDESAIYKTSGDDYSEFVTEKGIWIKCCDGDNDAIYKTSIDKYSEFGTEEVMGNKFRDGDDDAIYKTSFDKYSEFGTNKVIGIKFHDGEDEAIYKTSIDSYSEFDTGSKPGCPGLRKEEGVRCSNLNTIDCWPQQKCSVMCFPSDNKRRITEIPWGDAENMSSRKLFKRFSEKDWSPLPAYFVESPKNCSVQLSYETPSRDHGCGRAISRKQKAIFNQKKCSGRSHSAPPCYKGRKRYMDLTDASTILSAKCNIRNSHAKNSSDEPSYSKHTPTKMTCLRKSFSSCLLSGMKRSFTDCSFPERQCLESRVIVVNQNGTSQKGHQFGNLETVGCLDTKQHEDSFDSGCKWRNSCLSFVDGDIQDNKNWDNILDISSDMLNLAGDSLVPKSIGKMTLEDARVLKQVDKKFIPVVAGKNLAIIDQHAADERIRLEDLRHKVLTGEMRTITYLDTEQELVLPEIGYQLLHNYAEQIQTWGWICNIHSQDKSLFSKHLESLHRQPTVVKLLAVPCILGVNLTDSDLLEFLQQLADTDGSSTIPPAVNRVLNNKACRGAIMFGDALLPSECSLIVEELRQTSLCFQCAHGRPTTVPLVNLDVLHRKIAKRYSPKESWHELSRHKLSLQRSTWRLNSALC